MADRNRQVLEELLKKPENKLCADCKSETDVGWASCNIGVFLCQICAGIHRNLGTDISRIKSIRLDNWDDDHVKKMAALGNKIVNEKYEKYLPLYYKRPTNEDTNVLRSQFIRAKYQRKEFMFKDKQSGYSGPQKEGSLMKKMKDNKNYFPRRFVLSTQENTLSYYVKDGTSKAKETINLEDLNAVFVPDKTGKQNGLQITYLKETSSKPKEMSTRSIFVYSEDPQEIVDWYIAIRAAKLERRKVAFPATDEVELAKNLTSDFICEGHLNKMGPNNEPFRKRWFTLDGRKLMYSEDPLSPYAKGEVFIGHRDARYSVFESTPPRKTSGCPFTLSTPDRDFCLCADNLEERERWMDALNKVIDVPPTPQDLKLNSIISQKKR